jgi:hypothetical protein
LPSDTSAIEDSESTMLNDIYLNAGLDAMVRAFAGAAAGVDGFVDGHRAAGMLTAWLLADEGLVEESALGWIARALDSEWMSRPLFAPLSAGGADAEVLGPAGCSRLVEAAWSCVGTSSGDAHPVIFPSLALKVLARRPQAATRGRIDGLCHMARVHAAQVAKEAAAAAGTAHPARDARTSVPDSDGETAQPFDAAVFSAWALEAFADGSQGEISQWPHLVGHILTYSTAVMDLHQIGHEGLARKAESGLRSYVASARQVRPTQQPAPGKGWQPAKREVDPEGAAYWEGLPTGSLDGSIGHALKYPYGYLRLLRQARAAAPTPRLRALAYKVLDCYLAPPLAT